MAPKDFSRSTRQDLRQEAVSLRRNLDLFIMRADARGNRARQSLNSLPLPPGTDWRWRPGVFSGPLSPAGIAAPESGQALGPEVALWHDCPAQSLVLRQNSNQRATDLAPFGLHLEVFGFAGSYLSLSVELPETALEGLTRNHILRLETSLQTEQPLIIYGRLNIGHGPNTEQLLQQLSETTPDQLAHGLTEFDLAYTEMNERRLEKIWLDLIFEAPRMNAIDIRDLFLSRHMRANV